MKQKIITQKPIERKLEFIFLNVTDWLKFAEAKNAILVTLNVGCSVAFMQLAKNTEAVFLQYYCVGITVILLIAAGFSLISFAPQLEIPWLSSLCKTESDDNILFYGHIANFSPEEFLKDLYRKVKQKPIDFSGIEQDYAKQIIINSRIALQKYDMFKIAMYLTILAVAFPAFIFILTLSCWIKLRRGI